MPTFSGFVVQKNSKWKESFSNAILNLHETNQIKRLIAKWMSLPDCNKHKHVAKGFPWKYFGGLLTCTFVTVIVSVFILLFENIYTGYKTSKERSTYALNNL